MRHAEWIQNFLIKSDVEVSGSGTIKITPHDAHTGDKAPSNDFWSVGHVVTKTLTSSLSLKTEVCVTTVRGHTVTQCCT